MSIQYKSYSATESLNLVFLGCGNIVKGHSKNIKWADKNIKLSYASRTLAKAEDYVKKYNGHKAYGNYNQAMLDETIDIVFITTPPKFHFNLAKKALDNGKHVIVEKPPFFNSSDFDILGKLADSKGLQLLVGENYFYKPMRNRIKKLLDEKAVGKPLFININATKKQKSKNDWREDEELSGYGALFEGGIHWINFINNIGLDIKTITGFRPDKESTLERSIQVTATAKSDTIINLLYSWEVDTLLFGLRLSKIFGTEGSITFESNGITVLTRGRKKSLGFPQLTKITGFKLMFKDFFVSLRAGNRPAFDYHKAKEDLVLIEKVYASLANQT